MPRKTSLPTPASSTDIKAQDGPLMTEFQLELPPPAVPSDSLSLSQKMTGFPAFTQPSETTKVRRRSSVANSTPKDPFELPPPPTRQRKIIQMKPREGNAAEKTSGPKSGKGIEGLESSQTGTKRKQTSTSAASKKISRKTAHSIIERRRRSKMNEEFAVLKSLIPACKGDMHKLAILQAAIEYVRYLEDCVAKLKAQVSSAESTGSLPSPTSAHPSTSRPSSIDVSCPEVDMAGAVLSTASPEFTPMPAQVHQPSISPALGPQDLHGRHYSCSSISSDYYGLCSTAAGPSPNESTAGYTTPSYTSPRFGPTQPQPCSTKSSGPYSDNRRLSAVLISPALLPQLDQKEVDEQQAATAALLMLNREDRNSSNGGGQTRGLSVKDLLSS